MFSPNNYSYCLFVRRQIYVCRYKRYFIYLAKHFCNDLHYCRYLAAYIYPAAVSSIVKPSTITSINYHKETEKDIERITLIVKTIIISAIVIFSIVIINLTKPIFSNLISFLHKHVFCKFDFLSPRY